MALGASQLSRDADWRMWCKSGSLNKSCNYNRCIWELTITRLDPSKGFSHEVELLSEETSGPTDFYVLTITGSSFLWHMVRCIMSILFLIGMELEPLSTIDDLMNLSLHLSQEPNFENQSSSDLEKVSMTHLFKILGRPAYPFASQLPLLLVNCGYAGDDPNLKWISEEVFSKTNSKFPGSVERRGFSTWFQLWKETMTRGHLIGSILNSIERESDYSPKDLVNFKYCGKGYGAAVDLKVSPRPQYVKVMKLKRSLSFKEPVDLSLPEFNSKPRERES